MSSVSVDGFMEGPDHDLGWHMVDDEILDHHNAWLAGAGAFLDGRVTYELMAAYWPTADRDPDTPRPVAEFARIWRAVPKIVWSRTMAETSEWNTTVLREVVPADVVELKARPGGDMVLGGAHLASEFARLDLIDEYRLYIHPVVIGRGTPALRPSDAKVPLNLVENHTFGNGVVMLRYQRRAG